MWRAAPGSGLVSVAVALVACAGPGVEPPGPQTSHPRAEVGAGDDGPSGGAAGPVAGRADAGSSAIPGADSSGANPIQPDSGAPPAEPGADDADGGAIEAGDAGPSQKARPLQGPSYLGSTNNSAECGTSYPTRGHEPVDGERHPLFLYFVGTAFVPSDPSASYESIAALAVTEAMARRGFVALSVQYDNGALAWLSDHVGQLACLFGPANQASLVARACALPNVDCDRGIAAWGHSQGAYVAHSAHRLEPRVRAVWATGYGGDASSSLPVERLRVVNAENDAGDNGSAARLRLITGFDESECPEPDHCLREDGSGFIIVRRAQLAMPETSSADHCWFDRAACSASEIRLEPSFIDPHSQARFALEPNADWVARTVARE